MLVAEILSSAASLISSGLDFLDGDKKHKAELLLEQVKGLQKQNQSQAKINEIQVAHRSIFVAGPRPFIMWICGFGLASEFLLRPWVQAFYPHIHIPSISDVVLELILALSGLAGLRTFEKKCGLTK